MNLYCTLLALLLGAGLAIKAAALVPPPKVLVTEIMYHPTGGDAYEFIKLQNFEASAVDLSEAYFSGITYSFPAGTSLKPGEKVLLISNGDPAAFGSRYPGVPVFGQFAKHLSNSGEKLSLYAANGTLISTSEYGSTGIWPTTPDGAGYSLQLIDPNAQGNDPANWRPSASVNGDPGKVYETGTAPVVRINEFMADNKGAVTNGTSHPDWIELHNSGTSVATLTGWTLTDSGKGLGRFKFPDQTTIRGGGYLIVWCDSATNASGLHAGFGLDREGQTVGLFDAQTNRVDAMTSGLQVADYSFGRVGNGFGLLKPTPGAANSAATIGSQNGLLLNEWYVNSGIGDADWVEIYNPSTNSIVPVNGLLFQTLDGTFRQSAYGYLAPGGFAQLYADEKTGANHLMFKLPSSPGFLVLAETNGTIMDRVDYGAQTERFSHGRLPDGSSHLEYFVSTSSPGASNSVDNDGDGLPDFWETRAGLDPANPADAKSDTDKDGMTAVQEYGSGTDPNDATSVLRLRYSYILNTRTLTLAFTALPDRSYSLIGRAVGTGSTVRKVLDVDATTSTQAVTTEIVLGSAGAEWFQVVTPKQLLSGESLLDMIEPAPDTAGVPPGVELTLGFNLALAPQTTLTNLVVVDDLGRNVEGKLHVSSDLMHISFVPTLPWAHQTKYTWRLLAPIRFANGQSYTPPGPWMFTTMASAPLIEDRSVYGQDKDLLVHANVTLVPEPGGYTFADVMTDDDPLDEYDPTVPSIFKEGTFGVGVTLPNSEVGQRGQSVRQTEQRSFKVALKDSSPAWRNLRTINLNKHPYDLTRVRNRLAFELLQGVDNMTSLRSFFVQLNIGSTNYGLFSTIENPDTLFLESHGLDPKAHLYKATHFEFLRYPEILKLKSDAAYSKSDFENVLEIKGSNDHGKLLAMLDAVNDGGMPINRVIDKYFNRENYLTWFAVNILMGNLDTESQNYFLYSPSDSSAWYFLSWDFDGSWGFYEQPSQAVTQFLSRWQEGLPNWWNTLLHQRFISEPANLAALQAKVEQLRSYLSPARISTLLEKYRPVVEPIVLELPDSQFLPLHAGNPQTEFEAEFGRLTNAVATNYVKFINSLDRPMPVFLGPPEGSVGNLEFYWGQSASLRGFAITYDFQVSKTADFTAGNIVANQPGLIVPMARVRTILPAGEYFYRVIIRASKDPQINWQVPFDSYFDAQGKKYEGVVAFTIP